MAHTKWGNAWLIIFRIQGLYAIWSETRLKLTKYHSSITFFSVVQLFGNFAQSMAVILSCSVQYFKLIGWISNEIPQDSGLRWVLDPSPQPSRLISKHNGNFVTPALYVSIKVTIPHVSPSVLKTGKQYASYLCFYHLMFRSVCLMMSCLLWVVSTQLSGNQGQDSLKVVWAFSWADVIWTQHSYTYQNKMECRASHTIDSRYIMVIYYMI